MSLLFGELLRTRAHFSLRVFYQPSTKDLDALIKVFDCEDHAWTTGQSLNFSPSVVKFSDKPLDFRKLSHNIEMTVWINS